MPARPLIARDLRANYDMSAGVVPHLPYLFDLFEHELGIRVACTATAIEITERTA